MQQKKLLPSNYRNDKYFPLVARAFREILAEKDIVAPIDVLYRMGRLTAKDIEDWRFGRINYLERVMVGNLSKANRILRIIRFYAHDLDMVPSQTDYRKWGKGKKIKLRFSKTGVPKLEEKYACHFRWNRRKRPMEVIGEEDAEEDC